jgi:serine/threonine transporter
LRLLAQHRWNTNKTKEKVCKHNLATTWLQRVMRGNIVKQILAGLVLGILLSWLSPDSARAAGLLGTLFVGALKAVAPVLVLMLVMASVANHQQGQKISIRPILLLYLIGTFSRH